MTLVNTPPSSKQTRIAFVLGGGGITGACRESGALLALAQYGIVSTENLGNSAGAIIGALDSAGFSAERIVEILLCLRDEDVREKLFLWPFRLGWTDHIFRNDKIRTLLESLLPANFSDLHKPLSVMAVNPRTGSCLNVATPNLSESPAQAVLASMAIPSIFPPVRLKDGDLYWDGGIRQNVPLPLDWPLYHQVWVLMGADRPHDYQGKSNVITNAVRAMHIRFQDEQFDVMEQTRNAPNVHVLWPDVPTSKGFLHFDRDLIGKSYDWTVQEIERLRTKEGRTCMGTF